MLGLRNSDCRHLLFSARLSLDATLLEKMGREFNVDLSRKRRWRLEERASVDEWVEYVEITLERKPGREAVHEIEFHYDTDTPKRKPKGAGASHSEVAKQLSIMSGLREPAKFECEASFEFAAPGLQEFFPIKVGEVPQAERPFDEIRGLSMVKLKDGDVQYTATLETSALRELSLTVSFEAAAHFSRTLPQRVLQQAVDIKSRFLE